MAVDPRLVTIVPTKAERVVSNRLDLVELEVSAFDPSNRTLVTLAIRAGAIPAE